MPYIKQENRPDMDKIVKLMKKLEVDVSKDLVGILYNVQTKWHGSEFDKLVELIIAMGVQANGDLNYILYKYCLVTVSPSYNNYKRFIGGLEDAAANTTCREYRWELRECAAEIRRRLLGPYEDTKIAENGDVTNEL